ncbi:TRL-like family protein [Helicobacter equorum]|uniref:TRL-like family protein n=1 Tax=Helicobacter equorum TaxID=361872 RepID=UPI000CF16C2D|nr:TRL-like family protein [Helicobacter equorum]
MKSVLASLSVASILLVFSGCATTTPIGAIFTDVTLPLNATSANSAIKKGEATCTSILSLVATGDCSIQTAAQNGNIQTIRSVENKAYSVLGIYSVYTTIVWGN